MGTSEGEMTTCNRCGREYEIDRSKGNRGTYCNSCYFKRRKIGQKEKLVDMLGGECSECGYDDCIQALDFHHVGDEKEFEISTRLGRSAWDTIKEEAEKCILLCSNCHRKMHCELEDCTHERPYVQSGRTLG